MFLTIGSSQVSSSAHDSPPAPSVAQNGEWIHRPERLPRHAQA